MHEIFADTGCGVSLVNIKKLTEEIPDYQIRIQTKPEAIKIRGFGNALFTITEHFPIIFRIPGQTVDGSTAITSITRHVYIIEKFKTKMFIKNDILNPEMMVPDIGKSQLTIGNFKNIKVKFNVKNFGPPIKQVIRFNGVMKIPARFNSIIPFKLRGKNFPAGRDIMFISKRIDQLKNNDGFLSHIINFHTISVQVINTSSKNVY